jgi:hypothetical protein
MNQKNIVIFGGGTISHVRSHLALCAPAYGSTARRLQKLCKELIPDMNSSMCLTKMADPGSVMETNEDVEDWAKRVISDLNTKIVFFSCAMCDFEGTVGNDPSGKYAERLKSRHLYYPKIDLHPSKKVINLFRAEKDSRKDIFLVGFKTTCGATEDEQYIAGLDLCKKASCNLVLANDVKTRLNMVITPEEARYHVTTDRDASLRGLVEMTKLRSHLTFTRSTVVAGSPIPWKSELVPEVLRTVVDYCVRNGAYKVGPSGATVGHFAAKIGQTTFLTSIRKTNFNDIEKLGLVRIVTDGTDSVIAYGAKPSVGGQSQRIVFSEHPDCDCILHFHCPIKEGSKVPTVSQREYECGSHQCGQNTSKGLMKFGNLYAVYLDHHGPNIVFNKSIDPREVIDFIEQNFDLEDKTGGPVSINTSGCT